MTLFHCFTVILLVSAAVFALTMYYHTLVLNEIRDAWASIHKDLRIGVLKAEQIPQEIIARMKL
jgi:hypothetical protein